jgi:signal transduction histidine kinase/CheY-like chemotaxis protein
MPILQQQSGVYNTPLRQREIVRSIGREMTSTEQLIKQFFERASCSLALLDRSFNYIHVNQAYADQHGRPVDFFLEKSHFDVYSPDLQEMFEKARDTKSLIQIPAHLPGDPQGQLTPSDWTLDPILNDGGEIDFFVLAPLEVSGNIHAERARQENGVIHCDDRERYWGVIAEAEKNVKAYDTEYRLIRPSGELRYVREVGEPVVDKEGKFVKTVGTLQDITEIKQAGLEILAAKEEAEFANNAKSEFLARMSHELRTPLNAVLGFGQLLELDKDILTEQQNEGISHIIAGGKHLLQLIDEVLDIARADSGNLAISMEAVSLDQALGEALLLINPLAAKHKITLGERSNKGFHVFADERRLKQVLVNLLSNAVKYNRAGGMVEVSNDAIEDGLIRIAVSDTGIGIRAEDQATLFEPFARVSGSVQSAEGTGIGLTITKRLVELMGGVIGFESEYGKGTTFWVVLPGAPESNEAGTEADWTIPPAITGRLKNLKILYVEDIPINLELMRQLIRRITGNDLLCATNARDGIDMAKTHKPDLILMDISLPGMDGFEALDVLKAGDDTAHIPVMAVTAHATREQVERAQETAFENYLVKPVIINQLIAALNDVVTEVSDSE